MFPRKQWFSTLLFSLPLILPLLGVVWVARLDLSPQQQAAPTVAPTVAPTEPVPDPTATPEPSPRRSLSLLTPTDPPYIPILMYHYVREVEESVDPLGFRLSVRPERFVEQLAWLRDQGYETLLMRELAACLRGELRCPARSVALTFDDGYSDQFQAALPALQQYGFRATFYIVTGHVGREGYMDWEQLEQLRDRGMEVAAHTVSHADLASLPLEQALVEINGSRAALESRLGVDVVSFSYPAGSYSPELARTLWEAGFTSAVTTAQHDDLSHLYELPRRRVLGGETIAGYPWYFRPLPREGR